MDVDQGQTPRRNRRVLIIVGIIAGLVLVGLGWIAVGWLVTPHQPDPARASAAEIAHYMSHPFGMRKLQQARRQALLDGLVTEYQPKERRQDLATALETLTPAQREIVRDAVFDTVKTRFLADARAFERIQDPAAQQEFLFGRMDQYDALRRWLAGGRGMPSLAASMSDSLTGGDEAYMQYIVTHTTAEQREMIQGYLEKIAAAASQRALMQKLSTGGK